MRMKSIWLSFLVSLLFSQLAFAQDQRSAPDRDVTMQQNGFLRHARTDVEAEHEAIWTLETGQARERYRSLPSEMKADVWTIHLERFLIEHPDLTPAQRAVVSDALDLIASGLIEANNAIDHSSPLWETIVHQPVKKLQERANAEFGDGLERDIFTRIGVRRSRVKGRIELNDLCNCNTTHPLDCSNCIPRFQGGMCSFTMDGCGILGTEPCNGRCAP
jgi:hypothetical protein